MPGRGTSSSPISAEHDWPWLGVGDFLQTLQKPFGTSLIYWASKKPSQAFLHLILQLAKGHGWWPAGTRGLQEAV